MSTARFQRGNFSLFYLQRITFFTAYGLANFKLFSNKWFSPSHFRPEWSSTVNMEVLLAGFPLYVRSLLHRETAIFLVSSLLLTLSGTPSLWRLLGIPNCVYYGLPLTQTCYWIVCTHACTHAHTYLRTHLNLRLTSLVCHTWSLNISNRDLSSMLPLNTILTAAEEDLNYFPSVSYF